MAEQGPSKTGDAETQFLRLCLRARWDPVALETARQLAACGGLDWETVYQTARREGVAPLLYSVARSRSLFPPSVEQGLQAAYQRNARRNLLVLHRLERVLHDMAAEGVPTIVLKGAALAEGVYGNLAVRPMVDLDLLIGQGDLSCALHVLSALGYQPVYPERREGHAAVYSTELKLVKPAETGSLIEIHWSVFGQLYYHYTVSMDWFWQTALPIRVGAVSSWALGPEAQVLHLCAHTLQHGGWQRARWIWLQDVAEVIAFYRDKMDWELLLARAQAYDLVLPVQGVLSRVAEEWNAPIPPAELERLRALHSSRREERVFTWLSAAQSTAQHFWAGLAGISGWRARFRYARCILFPSAGYMQFRYRIRHRFLVPLYYPYRWLCSLRSTPPRRQLPERTA